MFSGCMSVFVSRYLEGRDLFDILHTSSNVPLCAALGCFQLAALPFFAFRALVRGGGDSILGDDDGAAFVRLLLYFLCYFRCSGAKNYTLLLLRFGIMLEALLPDVRRCLLHSLAVSLSGRWQSGQAMDLVTERVRGVVFAEFAHARNYVITRAPPPSLSLSLSPFLQAVRDLKMLHSMHGAHDVAGAVERYGTAANMKHYLDDTFLRRALGLPASDAPPSFMRAAGNLQDHEKVWLRVRRAV